MAIKSNRLLGATAVALCLLLATACSHMAPAVMGPQDAVELQATAMAAQGGNGFVCDGGERTFTCFCKKGSVGNFACSGMEQFCRATGHPQTCSADGWCHCGGLYPRTR